MAILENQNLTQGQSEPDITHVESAQASSTVNNTVIALGVLTFALQLCLVLFFMLRCWQLDNRIKETLKDPSAVNKPSAPSSSAGDIYKQTSYQPGQNDAASSRVFFATGEPQPITNYLFAPSIPWDLVQR